MFETFRSLFAPPISADPAQATAKLAWVVRLRWIAVLGQVLSVGPALYFGILEERLLPAFGGVIAVLASLNIVTWMALRRGVEMTQGRILFQLGADVVALACLLALTGGAWNPLAPILFVHSGLGALLLEGRLSFFLFTVIMLCLASIQMYPNIPPGLAPTLIPASFLFPAQILLAVAFWILMTWLGRTLFALQAHFAFLSERKTRIDRLRAVGALAAGLSHEFATPLNTAQMKLNRLARTQQLDDNTDLGTARAALQRCGEVLRHMSGAQLKPEGLSLEVVDVDQLVGRVCSSVMDPEDGALIRFSSEGRRPRYALLPDVAFSQALINLIDNAIESGSPDERVDIVVGSRGEQIEVSVRDRGEGWPQVVRNHLGEPFVTTKPDGVGLGLYYVYNLAEAVGAELSLEDRDQGGAVAVIRLPAVSPNAESTR